jgi:nicotinamidase-related amidase
VKEGAAKFNPARIGPHCALLIIDVQNDFLPFPSHGPNEPFDHNLHASKHHPVTGHHGQNKGATGGSLGCGTPHEANEVVKRIVSLMHLFKANNAKIVATRDWHPWNHLSFEAPAPYAKPTDEHWVQRPSCWIASSI